MIVTCTNCQAKFRVPDERIGPRGAKVRCSRCQTVFRVAAQGAAAAPAVPPPLPPAAPAPAVELENPFAAPPATAPEPGGAESLSPDDPFAAAGFGAAIAPAPGADPFAVPSPAPGDPFATAAAGPEPADLFAAPPAGDAGPLPVTDLSDLLGSVPAPEVAPPEEAGEPPPLGIPPADLGDDLGGLALEDRTTPPPVPAARRALEAAEGAPHAGDPFAADQGFGAYDLGAAELDGSLALAGPAAAAPAPPAPPPLPAGAEAPLELAAPAAPPSPHHALEAPAPEPRPTRPRRSRLRAVVVNAVALAALILVAGTMLAVWRSGGPLDAQALRPSRLLAALGGGGGGGPFVAQELRSGAYERERGPPLLFVRGKVRSRADAPVPGVKVLVEVVRGELVVARGEALAGAVPTAEELYHAVDAEALAALARTAAARAPATVRPGEVVPFLVAIQEHPADLEGATLRVEASAAGEPAR